MSRLAIELLREHFRLLPEETKILGRNIIELDRRQRKRFHRDLEHRLALFRQYLKRRYEDVKMRDPKAASEWATATALSIVQKGYADFTDEIMLDIVGRRRVSDLVKSLKAQL